MEIIEVPHYQTQSTVIIYDQHTKPKCQTDSCGTMLKQCPVRTISTSKHGAY